MDINRSTAALSCEGGTYREAYVGGFSEVDTRGVFDARRIYDEDVRNSSVPIGTTPEDIARIGRRHATVLMLAVEAAPSMQDLAPASPDGGAVPWEEDDPLGLIFNRNACVPGALSGYGPEMLEWGLAYACYSLSAARGSATGGGIAARDRGLDGGEPLTGGRLRGREAIECLLGEREEGLDCLDAARE